MSNTFKYAKLGSVSSATLRTEDLLSSFADCLEGLMNVNGWFLSYPENRAMRDRLNKLCDEARDAWNEDGETLTDEDNAREMVTELEDALNEFAPPYAHFGAHKGDGADFGFWADIEQAKEEVGFVSVKSHADAQQLGIETNTDNSAFPPDDYRGEWLHVSDHGNATLYDRQSIHPEDVMSFRDVEIWSVV